MREVNKFAMYNIVNAQNNNLIISYMLSTNEKVVILRKFAIEFNCHMIYCIN